RDQGDAVAHLQLNLAHAAILPDADPLRRASKLGYRRTNGLETLVPRSSASGGCGPRDARASLLGHRRSRDCHHQVTTISPPWNRWLQRPGWQDSLLIG